MHTSTDNHLYKFIHNCIQLVVCHTTRVTSHDFTLHYITLQ